MASESSCQWADGGGFVDSACCEECGCMSYSAEWFQAFGVAVCNSCRRGSRYKLISKATAKSAFLLTDGDLKHLGFLTKANPQHKAWQDMKLYLGLQVSEVARRKHGDADAIQAARAERVEARIANRLAKRKAAEAAAVSDGEADDRGEAGGSGPGRPKAFKPQGKAQERVWERLQQEYAGTSAGSAGVPDAVAQHVEVGGTGAQVRDAAEVEEI